MATRARQEEELVESTSKKDEIGSVAASEEEPVVVEEGPVTIGKPVHEGKTENPKEGYLPMWQWREGWGMVPFGLCWPELAISRGNSHSPQATWRVARSDHPGWMKYSSVGWQVKV